MRVALNKIIFALLVFTSLWITACKNEESWSYKAWHNTLAHYNTFFNAEQKWLETMELTREGFKDDFRKPIALFNYGTADVLKGNQSAMDEVIKKASTMIDKHPKSRWVDDAYLLNGKAYFLKGEISAAMDLFEYVNSHFKDPEIQFTAQLWIARCLFTKGQKVDAEVLVQNLLKDPTFPKSLLSDARWVYGALQFSLGKYQQAKEPLEFALANTRYRMDRYRLHFALGQCYQFTKEYDKAELHFGSVARFNPPYELAFAARMAQVDILSAKQENYVKANKVLQRMLKDDKNVDFLGQIYVNMGINELKAQNYPMAQKRFNQAIQLSTNNEHITNAYLALGDHFFTKRAYQSAAIYYDSANAIIDKSHPDFDAIVQKNDILSDLLKEVMTVSNNDSLLRMVKDPKWRAEKIAEAIEREKKAAEASQKAQELAQSKKDNSGMNPAGGFGGRGGMGGMGGAPPDMGAMSSGNSSFPFYNALNRSKSTQEFQKTWGSRENRDFWKYAAKKIQTDDNITAKTDSSANQTATAKQKDTSAITSVDLPKDISDNEKKYYANLPLSEKAQKQALIAIEKALFEGGKIYQDRLQEFQEAIRMFAELVNRFPFSENVPQILYELIKINRLTGDYSQADVWKAKLLTEHPKSVYVRMLETGGSLSDVAKSNTGNQQIDSLFAAMLEAYNTNKFNDALEIKMRADKDFAGNQLQTKFDYLQSLCHIKSGNTQKGIDLLQQLVIDYPSSDISTRAREIIDAHERLKLEASEANLPKTEASTAFIVSKPSETLDCIFTFAKGTNTNMIRAALSDFGKKQFSFETLLVNTNTAVGSQNIIRISQFSKPEVAKEFVGFLQKSGSFFAEKGLYEYKAMWITEANFLHLTKTLDLNGYSSFYEKQ